MADIAAQVHIIRQIRPAAFPMVIPSLVLEVDIVAERRIPKLRNPVDDLIDAVKIKTPLAVGRCFLELPAMLGNTALKAGINRDVRQRRPVLQ